MYAIVRRLVQQSTFNKRNLVLHDNCRLYLKWSLPVLTGSASTFKQIYTKLSHTACDPLQCIEASDNETFTVLSKDMLIYGDFITEEEEESLYEEVQNHLKRLRYETSHWDDAIHGYRETEKRQWSDENTHIIERVRDLAFPTTTHPMSLVHVLDLQKSGYIKAHVDSVRFCGDVIAGISLLSDCVMRLVHERDKTKSADCLLNRRSLYVMKNEARYDYTHEVLKESESAFRGSIVPRERRISVICRCEANKHRQHEGS